MAIVFKNTDQLWGAVLAKLPNKIQEKVSAPAGKPYIHIKPQSKHIGIRDFKYCVEYSSKAEKASVHVESLNGGEAAKAKIQQFIDRHEDGHILDGVVAQQGAKNKNKWSWEVATPANELNEELVQWYIDTINAFYEFFETPLEGNTIETTDVADKTIVENNQSTKCIRVALFANQPKFISLQSLCEEDMEVVDDNGSSEETYEHLVDNGSGEWVELAFVPSGSCIELNVTNPDADDDEEYNLYSDEEFEICPNYGMMNIEEAEENYDDDSASLEEYTAYLDVEMGEDHDRLTNKGIKDVWGRLKTSEVNSESFVPAVMQYVMAEEGRDKAFLRGLQAEDILMVFNIDIPNGEEFDPSKLDFINIDAEYDDNSEVLSELLADDMVLLNAIMYDGKMYFADGYDDITEDSWGDADCYYDVVDEDIASA